MSEPMVSPQSALEQLKRADVRWEAAVRAFDDFATRLRALADAAEFRSRALMLAHLANITGKPRQGWAAFESWRSSSAQTATALAQQRSGSGSIRASVR